MRGPIEAPFAVQHVHGPPGWTRNHSVMISAKRKRIVTFRRVNVFDLSDFFWRIETTPASKSQSSLSERMISPLARL
jgi:hypothetical protein